MEQQKQTTEFLQNRIKELEEEVSRLELLVVRDELTGALNRKGFNEKLDVVFKQVTFSDKDSHKRKFKLDDLSVIFIDVDDFKKVNDSYGHFVGDEVLKITCKIIRDSIREMDLFGRLGGEEFVIGLIGANENEAFRKAEEIRKSVEGKILVAGLDNLKITFSVGVASVKKSDSQDMTDLVSFADQAMYEAKTNRGKNNTVSYSEIS